MFAKICLVFVLFCISFCQSISNELIKSNNELAFDLFHTITSENNHFYSPPVIQTSLYKLLLGSKQQTKQELEHLLHLNANTTLINTDFNELKQLSKQSLNELKIANRFYISNKYPIKQQFKNSINDSIESVNFNSNAKNVTKLINKWVEEKTDSKVANLFRDSLPSESKLVLVNAIYFNGKWKQPFDLPTEKAEFFNFQSGSLIEMMQLKGELKVQPISELNAQIIELPFDNNQQTLYILLPNENEGIDEMNEKLTLPLLQQSIQTLNNSQSNQIQLFLPKFKIENEYDLREPLEELDAKTLFTDEADLSGISADNSLKLSSAIHHTVFEVNENGVKVEPVQPFSAQIIPDPEPEYRELRVDHPFTFFIYSNGLIVFVGQVRTLVDEQLLSLGFI